MELVDQESAPAARSSPIRASIVLLRVTGCRTMTPIYSLKGTFRIIQLNGFNCYTDSLDLALARARVILERCH